MISTSKDGDVAHGHDHGRREALRPDDGLALLALEAGHHAVHGRHHDRLAHVVAGAGQHGFLLADAALLRVHCRRLHLEVGVRLFVHLVGDELVVAHPLRPLESEPRVLDVRFRAREVGPRRLHRLLRLLLARLEPGGVDAREHLPAADGVPFLDVQLRDAAGDVGGHVHELLGLDLAGSGHGGHQIAARDLLGLDGDLVAAVLGHAEGDHASDGQHRDHPDDDPRPLRHRHYAPSSAGFKAGPALRPCDRPKYKIRAPLGKVSVSAEPCSIGGVRPRAAGRVSARNEHVRIRTPYRTNGFRRPSARSQSPHRGRQSARAADARDDAGRGRLRRRHRARRSRGHREGHGRGRRPRHPRRDDAAHERLPGLPPAQDRSGHQVGAGRDPDEQGPGGRPLLGAGDGRRLLHHQGLRAAAHPRAREEHRLRGRRHGAAGADRSQGHGRRHPVAA